METSVVTLQRASHEIGSYRTYEEWKLITRMVIKRLANFVLTVPMRNGNSKFVNISKSFICVLTVPMRNGNSDEAFQYAIENSSYRTYEEWKLYIGLEIKDSGLSSYRTYEEWKHFQNIRYTFVIIVLTVPMRNGNSLALLPSLRMLSSYRTYEEWKLACSSAFSPYAKFLPYL